MADAKITIGKGSDDDLLDEIRERFTYATDQWRDIRGEADKDMRYVSGDPWDPKDRKAREDAGRPVLALDELGQFLNQVVNDVRANPIAMNFGPAGNGADEQGAQFYADKAREIEYRSHAQIAYTTAFENCLQRSYGWARLKTDYASDRTTEQDITIVDVPDPNAVVPDPNFKRPDFSDGKYLFYVDYREEKEFKREFPDATITDFSAEHRLKAPLWFKADGKVQICEYWRVETKKRKLLLVQFPPPPAQPTLPGQPPAPVPPPMPQHVFEDELPGGKLPTGAQVLKTRTVDQKSVMQYITNGVEILERTPWAGKYIPFAACLGKVIYADFGAGTEKRIMSMTRLARDPYMLYCYYRTQQAEMAGMIPKAPVMGYKGQFDGVENDWQKAPHEPIAFLTVNAKTEATGETILPLPTRLAYEAGEHLQALELCAEGARRAIQAAMGSSPLPTQAQRHNEKSGVALKKIDETAQKGSFHFVDHYNDMIRFIGVMVEDLMDKIYDTARDVAVRKGNDDSKSVRINDPQNLQPGQDKPIQTQGDYLVTVKPGPSFESTQEAASDFADQLIQNPQVFPLVAADAVRWKNLGPRGEVLADALEVLKPPALQKQPDGSAPLPPEAQKAMAENQQLQQQMQELQQQIATDQAKYDAQGKIEQMKQQFALELAHVNNAAKLEAARITAAKSAGDPVLEAQEEALATGMEQAHEAAMQAADHAHDAEMAQLQHAQSLQAGDVAHGQAVDQSMLGHQQAIEQAANQAALQPPAEGAGA